MHFYSYYSLLSESSHTSSQLFFTSRCLTVCLHFQIAIHTTPHHYLLFYLLNKLICRQNGERGTALKRSAALLHATSSSAQSGIHWVVSAAAAFVQHHFIFHSLYSATFLSFASTAAMSLMRVQSHQRLLCCNAFRRVSGFCCCNCFSPLPPLCKFVVCTGTLSKQTASLKQKQHQQQ